MSFGTFIVIFFMANLFTFLVYQDYVKMKNRSVYGEERLFNTKNTYNGTIGYNGLFDACRLENPSSKPCTTSVLIFAKFWNVQIEPAWILDLQMNCVGYSSDNVNTIGMCVQTKYGKQVIPCSCNMEISVCCF